MRIERIDDKTVKCFLSNEELEEYNIDYKDFIMHSEKAKEVVQEIMEQAEEEVGYKPPKFAFDLQIMVMPQQGLVLTFSEKEPADFKDGEQILECLKDMKELLQKTKNKMGIPEEMLQAPEDVKEVVKVKKQKAPVPVRPEEAVFVFDSLLAVLSRAVFTVLVSVCARRRMCSALSRRI